MLVSGLLRQRWSGGYRPLRSAPRLIPLISAIGVSFFLQDACVSSRVSGGTPSSGLSTMDQLNLRFQLTETIDISTDPWW